MRDRMMDELEEAHEESATRVFHEMGASGKAVGRSLHASLARKSFRRRIRRASIVLLAGRVRDAKLKSAVLPLGKDGVDDEDVYAVEAEVATVFEGMSAYVFLCCARVISSEPSSHERCSLRFCVCGGGGGGGGGIVQIRS